MHVAVCVRESVKRKRSALSFGTILPAPKRGIYICDHSKLSMNKNKNVLNVSQPGIFKVARPSLLLTLGFEALERILG